MNDPDRAQAYSHYDDEISLYDLWDVLVRRVVVLVGVAVLTVVLGVVYALMQPVEYEYRSGVNLPGVYSGGALQEHSDSVMDVVARDVVISRLEDVLIPQERDAFSAEQGRAPDVRVSAQGSDYGLILTSISTREGAEHISDLHRGVVDALAGWLEPRFEQTLASSLRPLENRIDLLDEQIESLQGDRDMLNERLAERDDIAGLIVAQRISDLRRELAELRERRVDARSEMETITAMSRQMEETFLASESESPVGPGRSLIVALSVVLGGMLGLFAAFFWEFVANARSRRPQTS